MQPDTYTYYRKKKTIINLQTNVVDTFSTVNLAKKNSRVLQQTIGTGLGRGLLRRKK